MQTKTVTKKDSTVKMRYSGIKFLYMKPPASHKPFCKQRIRKRKLFFPTHTKHVSASHSMHNSSFHIKAKTNVSFYISTDIMSIRGEEEARIERISRESLTGFFSPPTTSTYFIILQSLQLGRICSSLPAFTLSLSLFLP